MKLSVRVRGDWFAVPCQGSETVEWMGQEAVRRYDSLKPSGSHVEKSESVYEIRKTRGGALLYKDDLVKSVLDDNDFVSVGESLSGSSPCLSSTILLTLQILTNPSTKNNIESYNFV